MLINNLRDHKELSDYISDKCDDAEDSNGNFKVLTDKTIKPKNIFIIKVDLYFNKKISPNPKGPDCLIIQRCAEQKFNIYMAEFKDVKRPKHINKENIREKFDSCFKNFIEDKFKKYFTSDKIMIRNIKLWLISDPHNIREHPERIKHNNVIVFKMMLGEKPIKYLNKYIAIEHNHENPTIKNCFDN
ncbi:MAG: hypothetical protein JRJ49_11040 [Deltaproteobacteria bacterium]|nr:hypothetical protein [Deltaproteobacteria bacterium]